MRILRRTSSASSVLGIVLFASCARAATQSSWITTTSGDWSDAARWSTNPYYPENDSPAGATYDALIAADGDGSYTVSISGSHRVDSITIDSPLASLYNGGALQVATINVARGMLVSSHASFVGTHFMGAGGLDALGSAGSLTLVTQLDEPVLGVSYYLMTGSSITGQFATVDLPPLSEGKNWQWSYEPTMVVF